MTFSRPTRYAVSALLVPALLGATAPAVYAMDKMAKTQDGIFISGGFNSTTQENNQSRNTGVNTPNNGAADGASGTVVDKESGLGFVLGLGYKKHFTSDFYASVEASYSSEDVETTIINNVLVNNVTLNSTTAFDLRLGHDVTDKVSVYGLIGVAGYDFDSQLSYTFAPPMDAVSETEWGATFGGGVEIAFNDRISTFGEFRLTNDLSFDTPVDQGGITSINELNYSTIRTGLRYSF